MSKYEWRGQGCGCWVSRHPPAPRTCFKVAPRAETGEQVLKYRQRERETREKRKQEVQGSTAPSALCGGWNKMFFKALFNPKLSVILR